MFLFFLAGWLYSGSVPLVFTGILRFAWGSKVVVWIKSRTGAVSCGVSSSILWNGQRYWASDGKRIV